MKCKAGKVNDLRERANHKFKPQTHKTSHRLERKAGRACGCTFLGRQGQASRMPQHVCVDLHRELTAHVWSDSDSND
jgi:hypothetical protein